MPFTFSSSDQDTAATATTAKSQTHRRRTSSSVSHGGGHLPAHYSSNPQHKNQNNYSPHNEDFTNTMETTLPPQNRKSMILRALAVIFFLLVFVWFMVPDGDEWNRGPIIPGFYDEHVADGDIDQDLTTASLVSLPSETVDYSKFESPPFNPDANDCPNPKNKSPIEYALMIDAGSTGSRIHVYKFSNCNESPDLINEVFEQIKPGLSSYSDDPQKAAASLDPLMEIAMKHVPETLRACTPIAVKATAGLRILGPEKSERILDAIRKRLSTEYPFPLAGPKAVAVMDGSDEGVYAWITVNYLLGNLGVSSSNESIRPTSAAVFDLGGASTQIVFEPYFPISHDKDGTKEQLAHGEHKYILQFSGREHVLYQHSYLGYGLMEARKKMKKYVASRANHSSNGENIADSNHKDSITHPCFPSGYSETYDFNDTYAVQIRGIGSDSPLHAQCLTLAEKILEKDTECPLTPCSFAGAYQPSLSKTFAKEEIYTFSYFYDRTAPLGMPSEFTLKDLRGLTQQVCSPNPEKYFQHLGPESLEELKNEPLWCMDLAFIYSLLRFGYDIPEERAIRVAKKVRDTETGWCLGAAMTMLDGTNFCEIK